MKHNLLSSLLLTALLTTTAPVLAQVTTQPTASNAAQVERIAELKKRAIEGVEARAKLAQEMNDIDLQLRRARLPGSRDLEIPHRHPREERLHRSSAASPACRPAGSPRWGSGGPVIALGSDIDGIPKASQKPGVAYREPMVEGAPGHGEGHNSGQAVNIVAALALKEIMEQREDPRHADALAGRRRGAARRQGLHGPRRRVQGRRRGAVHPCRQQSADRLGPAQRHRAWSRSNTRSTASPRIRPRRPGAAAARSTASS